MSKTTVITNRGVSIVRSAANRHDECVFVDAVSSTHFENTPKDYATKPGKNAVSHPFGPAFSHFTPLYLNICGRD